MPLQPHQQVARDAIIQEPGFILADPMGSGRSVSTLSALHALDAFPALVIAPLITLRSWARETAQFAPGRTAAAIMGERDLRAIRRADLVAINYEKVAHPAGQYRARLDGQAFRSVVVYEMHRLQGMSPERFATVMRYARRAERRIAIGDFLIGSPLGTLRSVLELVGHLGLWQEVFRTPPLARESFFSRPPWERRRDRWRDERDAAYLRDRLQERGILLHRRFAEILPREGFGLVPEAAQLGTASSTAD